MHPGLQLPSQLSVSLLYFLQFVSVSLILWGSKFHTILQVWSHKPWPEENNHLQSTGFAAAARLCGEPSSLQWHTAASYLFAVNKDHRSFSVECLSTLLSLACCGAWGYSTPGAGLCICLCWIYEVPIGPLLQLATVTLSSGPALQCISHFPKFDVIWKYILSLCPVYS